MCPEFIPGNRLFISAFDLGGGMKKILCLLVILPAIFFPGFCEEKENIRITTYYPSPEGVYGTLRLLPRIDQPEGKEGDLYYDSGSPAREKGLYVHDGTEWVKGGGGFDGDIQEVQLATPLITVVKDLGGYKGDTVYRKCNPGKYDDPNDCSETVTTAEKSFIVDSPSTYLAVGANTRFYGDCSNPQPAAYSSLVIDGSTVQTCKCGTNGYDYCTCNLSYTSSVLSQGKHKIKVTAVLNKNYYKTKYIITDIKNAQTTITSAKLGRKVKTIFIPKDE